MNPILYQSMLFMPGHKPRMHEKAAHFNTDAIILDLEDAVAEDAKHEARMVTVASLGSHSFKPDVLVRINHPQSPQFEDDANALKPCTNLHGIVIPKVESADDIADVAKALPNTALWINIETPIAVLHLEEIIRTAPPTGIIAGINDLSANLRLPSTKKWQPRVGLHHSLSHMVLVARAYGLCVVDGVYNRIADMEGLAAECAEGRTLGFDGKSLIHPSHIEITNATFSPTEEEIADAKALISAFETSSGGAVRHKGQMVEELHVNRARALVARHP